MLIRNWKWTLLAFAFIGAIAALSGGAIGLAQTQVDPTPGAAHHHGGMSDVVARAIGITPQELHQELPGKSLAQVAEEHGKTSTEVADALKSEANQRIDARIDRLMTRVVPAKTATPTGS